MPLRVVTIPVTILASVGTWRLVTVPVVDVRVVTTPVLKCPVAPSTKLVADTDDADRSFVTVRSFPIVTSLGNPICGVDPSPDPEVTSISFVVPEIDST